MRERATGMGGEATIEGETITVKVKMYYYGGSATGKNAKMVTKDKEGNIKYQKPQYR